MSGLLAGQRIGVLGLARSGRAAARLALAHGARVYASDQSDSPATREAAEQIRALGGDADAGRHDLERLAACDTVVLSPGIPPSAAVLTDVALADVPVISELEFAFRRLDAPVVAVTGTNGKTTVTLLISHLLHAAGMNAPVGGNVGTALSELALREEAIDYAVVEASSFQLAGIRDFAPQIGVVTNLAPDHLDRYATLDEYYGDKARLFRNATADSHWVLNAEDAAVLELPGAAPGCRYGFRVASLPAADEAGAWLADDGWLVLRTDGGTEERLIAAAELQIIGEHNVANALAAALAARLAGASSEAIRAGLRNFLAPAHRLERVADRGGVRWINDSKATNLASTRVALRSMNQPTILLLGGRHKGEPYTGLIEEIRPRVRHVVAYGEAADRIVADLGGEVPVHPVRGSFADVVRRAADLARPGDAVLLSPACSSYDMFPNFEERGRRFAELAVQQ